MVTRNVSEDTSRVDFVFVHHFPRLGAYASGFHFAAASNENANSSEPVNKCSLTHPSRALMGRNSGKRLDSGESSYATTN